MADLFGIDRHQNRVDSHILHQVQHTPLQQILTFLNLSIDDVYVNPVAQNAVQHYWRVYHLVGRRCAAVDAEHMRLRRIYGEPIATDNEEDALARSQKRL